MNDFMENEIDELNEDALIEAVGEHLGNLLIEYGYDSIADVREADDSELLDIHGIGDSTLETIREKTALTGVSDQPATTDSEVKPDSIEAEAAEGEIAEPLSADEAVAPDALPSGGVVTIHSLWPARMKMTAPSGQTYQWEKAGAQVNVAMEDVEFVMGKNRNAGRACCGSSGERIYFGMT